MACQRWRWWADCQTPGSNHWFLCSIWRWLHTCILSCNRIQWSRSWKWTRYELGQSLLSLAYHLQLVLFHQYCCRNNLQSSVCLWSSDVLMSSFCNVFTSCDVFYFNLLLLSWREQVFVEVQSPLHYIVGLHFSVWVWFSKIWFY